MSMSISSTGSSVMAVNCDQSVLLQPRHWLIPRVTVRSLLVDSATICAPAVIRAALRIPPVVLSFVFTTLLILGCGRTNVPRPEASDDQAAVPHESTSLPVNSIGDREPANPVVTSLSGSPASDSAVGTVEPSIETAVNAEPVKTALCRWLNESYDTTTYQVAGKKWAESENKTGTVKWTLEEQARDGEYIVLFNPTRNEIIRISATRLERKVGAEWTWLSNGRWLDPPEPDIARAGDRKPTKVAGHLVVPPTLSGKTTEAENAPSRFSNPSAEGSVDPRTKWVNTSYDSTVRHVTGKQWKESDNRTGRDLRDLEEVARTREYVELRCPSRQQTWRLMGTRLDFLKEGRWHWLSNGHWLDSHASGSDGHSSLPAVDRTSGEADRGLTASARRAGPIQFELAPPDNLRLLMQASEEERAAAISELESRIRGVLDTTRASFIDISAVGVATDTTRSIVAAAKASGIHFSIDQLGTLAQAEEEIKALRSQAFVRPMIRQFTPDRLGMVHEATVVQIFQDKWEQTVSKPRPGEIPGDQEWRRLLVEMPNGFRLMIKGFPRHLVAEGRPLARPDTIFATTGYSDTEFDGKKSTVLVAEVFFFTQSELDEYLEQLASERDAIRKNPPKIWYNKDGRILVKGSFIKFEGNKVHIRKQGGEINAVSMLSLSPDDQNFVRERIKATKK